MSQPAAGTITVRLVMPDRWLEHVAELPTQTTVKDAKLMGLRTMLLRETDDPADYYVEYAERKVADEAASLETMGSFGSWRGLQRIFLTVKPRSCSSSRRRGKVV